MFRSTRLRSLILVLCCFLLLGVALLSVEQQARAQDTTLLTNPGFEDPYNTVTSQPGPGSTQVTQHISGQIANGWSDDTAWTSDTIAYAKDTTIFHSGQAAQRIDITAIPAGQAMQFRQVLSLQASQVYTASVWLRGTPGMSVGVRLQLADAPYTSLTDGLVQLSDQWTQVSCTGQTPTAKILFQIRTTQTGSLWVDDANLSATPAPPLVPPTATVPRSYFGMEIKSPTIPWPPVNFGTLRLWDSGVPWNALEPSRGTYNFGPLDTWVNAAQQHNADVVLTLAVTPQWASSRPDEPSVYGPGGAAPPTNIQDWIDYVTRVATTYKGKIHYYEIWNEPDLPIFYTGTIDQLVTLAQTAYTALKAVDPTIQVISPPFSSSVGWLDNFLAQGGDRYADIIGFHFYATDNPEYMPIQITNVRLLLQKYHLAQPLWDTEAASGTSQTPEEQAAALVSRTYILNWAAHAERYVWYAWDNHVDYPGDAPLVQSDNTTITRGATAYAVTENWLTGSQMQSVSSDNAGTWQVQLKLPDGSSGWIVWNPNAATSFPIPTDWHARWLQDLYGFSLPLKSTNVGIAGSPILLTQKQPDFPTPPRPPAPTGINPLDVTQAARTDLYGGGDCQVAPFFGGNVGHIGQGSWLKYSHVTLPAGITNFTANIQTFSGVNAHLHVIVDAKPQPGCGLANGGTLVGGTQIADLPITPSSPQDFNGPYTDETTTVGAHYPTGTHDLYLLAIGTIGNLGSLQFSSGSLPSGWTHQNVGTVHNTGTTGYKNGIFTLSSSEGRLTEKKDAFQFAYQSWTGDGQIIAHLASRDNGATAGVMLRARFDNDALDAALVLPPSQHAQMIARSSNEGGTTVINAPTSTASSWVKLARQGNTFTGYTSGDGANWIQAGSVTVGMATTVAAGLVVASSQRGVATTATFDNVSVGPVTSLPGTWTDQDIGSATTLGKAGYNQGTFTVSSSGLDIWNTSDTFHYAYQPLTGDGQIVAHVVSQSVDQGTINEWAKAGIMVRAGLDPAAVHATVNLTPLHGSQMLTRTISGGSSNAVFGPFVSAPYWLKLVRQGSTLTGYTSGDGQNWTQLSTATIALGTTIYAGLVVTSSNSSQVATAAFDHVSIDSIS